VLSTANETPTENAQTPDGSGRPSGSGRLHAISPKRPDTTAWQPGLTAVGRWFARQLRRPRTRLAVIGVVLLLVALLGIFSSVWTLPLVTVGAVMVLIAWIGARLNGRFAVEWGEGGTQLEFRAQIRSPAVIAGALPVVTQEPAPAVRIPTLAELDDPDVIEGEGHTVEIDVAELKALIAAAEAKEADEARAQTPASGDGQPAASDDPAAPSVESPAQRNRPAA
jgi:hypothetical protein